MKKKYLIKNIGIGKVLCYFKSYGIKQLGWGSDFYYDTYEADNLKEAEKMVKQVFRKKIGGKCILKYLQIVKVYEDD